MESPPAREREDRLHDLAAGFLDARLRLLELARVEDHQRRPALRRFPRGNSAGHVRVLERRVVGTPSDFGLPSSILHLVKIMRAREFRPRFRSQGDEFFSLEIHHRLLDLQHAAHEQQRRP